MENSSSAVAVAAAATSGNNPYPANPVNRGTPPQRCRRRLRRQPASAPEWPSLKSARIKLQSPVARDVDEKAGKCRGTGGVHENDSTIIRGKSRQAAGQNLELVLRRQVPGSPEARPIAPGDVFEDRIGQDDGSSRIETEIVGRLIDDPHVRRCGERGRTAQD